mgnify:CR=1 FL=1
MSKKKATKPVTCDEHPADKVQQHGPNLEICGECGAHIHRNLSSTYALSERVTLEPGDLIKIKGVRGTHRYDEALLGQPAYPDRDLPGGDYVVYTMLDAGRPWKHGNAAHVDRVRRASRRSVQRGDED